MRKNLFILAAIPIAALSQSFTISANHWNLIGITQGTSHSLVDTINADMSKVDKIVTKIDGNWKVYDPNNIYLQQISNLDIGYGYWIKANADFSFSISGDSSSEENVFIENWNLVSFPNNLTTSQYISDIEINKGITISKIVTKIDGNWQVFDPSNIYLQQITTTDSNVGYWVNVSSIDYGLFIPNALPNESIDLPSIDQQTDLDNHSIITAKNVSDELKFYLTSVDSSHYYKKVELSNFSASMLNSSDSDINSTVSSQVSGYTTGTCGTIVLGSTDNMTVSVVNNEGNVSTTADAIYNGTDGNFTIGSEYEKVVWYGDAISLPAFTTCQVIDMDSLLPPDGGTPPIN